MNYSLVAPGKEGAHAANVIAGVLSLVSQARDKYTKVSSRPVWSGCLSEYPVRSGSEFCSAWPQPVLGLFFRCYAGWARQWVPTLRLIYGDAGIITSRNRRSTTTMIRPGAARDVGRKLERAFRGGPR